MKWVPWLILLMLVGVIWKLSSAVIRLENRSYASLVGLCYEPLDYTKDPVAQLRREKCLDTVQTRTSDWWHLWYALGR